MLPRSATGDALDRASVRGNRPTPNRSTEQALAKRVWTTACDLLATLADSGILALLMDLRLRDTPLAAISELDSAPVAGEDLQLEARWIGFRERFNARHPTARRPGRREASDDRAQALTSRLIALRLTHETLDWLTEKHRQITLLVTAPEPLSDANEELYGQALGALRAAGQSIETLRSVQEQIAARAVHFNLARAEMLEAHARLVWTLARQYSRRGVEVQDLVQEGFLGMMRALSKFDHERGYRFSTYASWWVRQSMTSCVASQSRTIRVPIRRLQEYSRVMVKVREFEQQFGRPPSDQELTRSLGLSFEELARIRQVPKDALSLETPRGASHTGTLADTLEAPHTTQPGERLQEQRLQAEAPRLLQQLSPREALVLRMRFGFDHYQASTLEAIGQAFGVSRERVRQIEARALKKLRELKHTGVLYGYLTG